MKKKKHNFLLLHLLKKDFLSKSRKYKEIQLHKKFHKKNVMALKAIGLILIIDYKNKEKQKNLRGK